MKESLKRRLTQVESLLARMPNSVITFKRAKESKGKERDHNDSISITSPSDSGRSSPEISREEIEFGLLSNKAMVRMIHIVSNGQNRVGEGCSSWWSQVSFESMELYHEEVCAKKSRDLNEALARQEEEAREEEELRKQEEVGLMMDVTFETPGTALIKSGFRAVQKFARGASLPDIRSIASSKCRYQVKRLHSGLSEIHGAFHNAVNQVEQRFC